MVLSYCNFALLVTANKKLKMNDFCCLMYYKTCVQEPKKCSLFSINVVYLCNTVLFFASWSSMSHASYFYPIFTQMYSQIKYPTPPGPKSRFTVQYLINLVQWPPPLWNDHPFLKLWFFLNGFPKLRIFLKQKYY